MSENSSEVLLKASDVRIHYHSVGGDYKVVDGVDITVNRNEIFGLAGESGFGKSTLVEGIIRLIRPPGDIVSGQALFYPHPPPSRAMTSTKGNGHGQTDPNAIDLFAVEGEDLRYLRWRYISYIPQGSMNSLNPVMRIGDQMMDVMLQHSELSKRAARERISDVLRIVGLSDRVMRAYPHELSGGMKQRVIIGMAVTLNPQLIVADEPTTALDVNVQRAVLETIAEVKERTGATIIFVSHDMAVHAELVDRLGIMYAGEVIEIGTVYEIFEAPKHPYTQRLIGSIPDLGGVRERLESITGIAPSPIAWPQGCRFHPRCPQAMAICSEVAPPFFEISPGHPVACHLYNDPQTIQLYENKSSEKVVPA